VVLVVVVFGFGLGFGGVDFFFGAFVFFGALLASAAVLLDVEAVTCATLVVLVEFDEPHAARPAPAPAAATDIRATPKRVLIDFRLSTRPVQQRREPQRS
jgi:hypothetical protein